MIGAIVLAAGLSRRMGRPKLLLEWDGQPVIRRSVANFLSVGVDDLVVVLGHEANAIREALDGLPVRFVLNPDPDAGQGSSIACGISALTSPVEAALIALGDQPALPPEVVPALLRSFRDIGKSVVAPVYRGVRGNPVLFARALFPELRSLTGDRGARALVERDPARVALIPFDLPMPADLDTPEDYEQIRPG